MRESCPSAAVVAVRFDDLRDRGDRQPASADADQAVLAAVLNTNVSTVRQWEIGEKRPSGPSLKLLDLLDRKGLGALL
jgi:putative transcriptional regulator